MRILVLTSSYFPKRGGLETVVHEVTQEWRGRGHTIRIVTQRKPLLGTFRKDALIARLPFVIPRWQQIRTGRLDLFLVSWILAPYAMLRMLWLVYGFRPQAIHFHYLGQPGPFVLAVARLTRIPLIVSLHGGDVDAEPHRSRFNRWIFRRVVRRSRRVTACSQALLSQAIALEPELETKAVVVHNGVDFNRFQAVAPVDEPKPFIFAVGQLAPHKGFDFLIRVFAQLEAPAPPTRLLIGGEGPARSELEELARDLNIASRVKFLGRLTKDEVAAHMKAAEFVAMPSRREPFGIVALEAMAAGKRLIATPIGGLPEFAATEDNRLLDLDAQLWIRTIQDWLHQPQPAANNLERAAAMTWAEVADRLEAIIRDCL